MSAITVMVRTNMAAMAQMFLAQRVRSIHTENATSLLGNLWDKPTNKQTTNAKKTVLLLLNSNNQSSESQCGVAALQKFRRSHPGEGGCQGEHGENQQQYLSDRQSHIVNSQAG